MRIIYYILDSINIELVFKLILFKLLKLIRHVCFYLVKMNVVLLLALGILVVMANLDSLKFNQENFVNEIHLVLN